MSQIMKTYMGVFVILLMAAVSMGILSSYIEVMNAQDMQARFVDEIEYSGFNEEVIRGCFEESNRIGNTLEIVLYGEDAQVVTLTNEKEPWTLPDEIRMARVKLKFYFRVPFLGINREHTIIGYARNIIWNRS